jgi:hypothetical protein
MMLNVCLQEAEWNQVINIIAQAPWTTANPLLTAITRQMQEQKVLGPAPPMAQMPARQQTTEETHAETHRANSGVGIMWPPSPDSDTDRH